MKRLVLMRGLPGSGKSTKARKIALMHWSQAGKSMAICSTDDYHMEGDEYVFKPDRLGEFHLANQSRARACMNAQVELVIVDNTNIKRRDMKAYIDDAKRYGYTVEEVIVGKDELLPNMEDACQYKLADYIDLCTKRNTHGVPRDAIEGMARKFQA